MSSKRDLLLVRLACRKRWLTAEQGEECIALSRRLGAHRGMDEILRLQGYLDADQLSELAETADHTDRRRGAAGRPTPPRRQDGLTDAVTQPKTQVYRLVDAKASSEVPEAAPAAGPRSSIETRTPDDPSVNLTSRSVSNIQDRTVLELDRFSSDADAATAFDAEIRIPETPNVETPHVETPHVPTRPRLTEPVESGGGVTRRPIDHGSDDEPVTQFEYGKAAEGLLGSFGDYELEAILARGAQGVVYRAHHDQGVVPVALRVLNLDPAAATRYLGERSDGFVAAAAFNHPQVVRLLDIGHAEGRHYVATELVEGWTLEELLLTDSAPSGEEALGVLVDVAEALLAAHEAGLAHGAFGPDRVLVEAGSRARVFGFGFALESDEASDARAFVALAELLLRDAPEPFAGWATPYRSEEYPDLERMRAELIELRRRPVEWQRPAVDLRLSSLATRAVPVGVGLLILSILFQRFVVPPSWSLDGLALLGALGLGLATLLFGILALIRQGELPLPGSTAWLVRLEEVAGLGGAALVAGGMGLVPLAGVHLAAGVPAAVCLISRSFGVFLRRCVAARRPDRGRGRMLAVLADPLLASWRLGHTPWVILAGALAGMRWALLAYFSAG